MSNVLVVGAGVGGLAVAARLAALGHQVTVCEQAAEVGGKLGRARRDRFTFDTGPSLLTMPQVLRELFAATGDRLEQVLDLQPLDPIAQLRFADGSTVDTAAGGAATEERIAAAFGPAAAGQWSAFFRRAERIWQASRVPFLESELRGTRTLLGLSRHVGDLAAVAPWRSLHDLAGSYLSDPRLRCMVERYATYAGSDPRRAPAALAAICYAEIAFGGWTVAGGLYRIAEALADRCTERGVRIRTDSTVVRIDQAGGRVHGVALADGSRLRCDVVVGDVDATHLDRDLLGRPPQRRIVGRPASPSLAGFVLLLGVRGRTAGLGRHTVCFPADYAAEFDDVFGARGAPARPVRVPTVYVSATPTADGRDESWFVLVNAPRHGSGSGAVHWHAPGRVEATTRTVLSRLAEHGLDLRGRIAYQEARTPAELAARTGAPGGAIYGTASHGMAGAFLRPANRSPIRGLFRVGGSAHPGGGVPLVMLSARIVSGLVGPANARRAGS